MNAPIEELLIKKCRTDPYLTYPQFERYLTGGQLKVILCLMRNNAANGKAFPSNERIAWETNLKIDSVRVIKCELCKIGILSKREIKRGANTIWVYTIDTTWKREQYRAEFDAHYNSRETPAPDAIKEEIERLKQALTDASPDNALEILERMKALLQNKRQSEAPPQTPIEKPKIETPAPQTPIDEAFADYIVAQTPNVQNKYAYKAKVKRLLVAGELDGIDDFKRGYDDQRRIDAIARYLKDATMELYGEIRNFDGEVVFDDEAAAYFAYFGGYKVKVSAETVKDALKGVT
ncbi:MAG: helix-turn-helix domain-containing protein [Helicobacteraceae bacterium]|jgi:hypothetical protein|nr:helix-turn-helix domain-containing protein [Helicobacteraceae bacterium]